MQRRRLLTAGASALAAALAGCTGDGDGGDETTTTATTTTTTTTATTEATTSTTTTSDDGYGGGGGEETTTTTTNESGGSADVTVVTVAPDGEFRFDPETVTVDAGTTVRWEWEGGGHNVRPASQPADADWPGTPGGDGETYDSGYAFEFAFEVPGRYDYYCAPHRSIGMTGSVVVE